MSYNLLQIITLENTESLDDSIFLTRHLKAISSNLIVIKRQKINESNKDSPPATTILTFAATCLWPGSSIEFFVHTYTYRSVTFQKENSQKVCYALLIGRPSYLMLLFKFLFSHKNVRHSLRQVGRTSHVPIPILTM